MSDNEFDQSFGVGSDLPSVYSVGNPIPKEEPDTNEAEPREPQQTGNEFVTFKDSYQKDREATQSDINQIKYALAVLLQNNGQQQQQAQPQQAQPQPIDPQQVSEAFLRGDIAPLQQTLVAPLREDFNKGMTLVAQALGQIKQQLGIVESRTSNPDMMQVLNANQARVAELNQFGVADPTQQYNIIKSELAKRPQTPNKQGQRGSERPGGSAGISTRTANTWQEQIAQEFDLYEKGQIQDMSLYPVGKFRM